jgi:peptidoglycan/xylan/chitin deacetylase (PgdA/CDA1 family)
MGRRHFLAMLGLGAAAALSACTTSTGNGPSGATGGAGGAGAKGQGATTTAPRAKVVRLDSFPPPQPGRPQTITHAPAPTQQIALTIDDGYCKDCVDAYVAFAQRTGIHITFSPNGTYAPLWQPHASVLRPLIEAGQVQIGNHTFSHANLSNLPSARVQAELERNESWIESTFGITSRPWFRPPFGFHNQRVDTVAGQLGYTHVLMWNGSFGDSVALTPQALMVQANKDLKSGTIMLGHANHPTVIGLFGQIQDLMASRGLQPATLDEMFGTSRATG